MGRNISIVETDILIVISTDILGVRYNKDKAEMIIEETPMPEKKGDYEKEIKFIKEIIQLMLM
jgi:hypothetical protein